MISAEAAAKILGVSARKVYELAAPAGPQDAGRRPRRAGVPAYWEVSIRRGSASCWIRLGSGVYRSELVAVSPPLTAAAYPCRYSIIALASAIRRRSSK